MIKDHVQIVRPTRVKVGVDRASEEMKSVVVVDEIVAEFWANDGEDLQLQPFIEHGVRYLGWRIIRRPGAHVVPEIESEVVGVAWRQVAEDMAESLRSGDVQAALDRHETAALQQAMFAEQTDPDHPGEHEHEWPGDELDSDAVCTVPGCDLRYGDWSEHP